MRKPHHSRSTAKPTASTVTDAEEKPLEGQKLSDDSVKERASRSALGSSSDEVAEHYGSRAETNAALEGKIALQNTRQLRHPGG